MRFVIIVLIFLFIFSLSAVVIEDFEADEITLESYPEMDIEPDGWELDSEFTYQNSNHSLHLWGESWKVLPLENVEITPQTIWSIKSYITENGSVQGIGFIDSLNTLLYSIDGTQEMNTSEWVTGNQGAFPEDEWNEILLPIADDWQARFDYLPTLTGVVFLNNHSYFSDIYFDHLEDITNEIDFIPDFEITYRIINSYRNEKGERRAELAFNVSFMDSLNSEVEYFWQFGDGEISFEDNPVHDFHLRDGHTYNVVLELQNEQDRKRYGSCEVNVDPGPSSLPLSMNFVGDIVLCRGIEDIIEQHPEQPNYIFQYVQDILSGSDISVANLESPITDSNDQHPTKGICFKADPDNIDVLLTSGIDVVTLANNHILDYMEEGITDTKNILTENNILHSGAGLNSYEAYRPLMMNRKGVSFAFLASSDRTGQYNNYQPYLDATESKAGFAYMTPYYVRKQIEEVRDISDHVIVELHAGSEYSSGPTADYDKSFGVTEDENYQPRIDVPQMWDREIRHFFIDNGADLVIVHHPHRIHGIEVYDGKVIAHSLGNFIFDLSYPETFPSMILHTEAYKDSLTNFKIEPIYIDEDIPRPAKGELATHLLDYVANKSRELDTYIDVRPGERYAEIVLDTLNMETTDYRFVLEDIDFVNDDNFYVSKPLALPRKGSISGINQVSPAGMYWARLGRDLLWHGNMESEGCTLWDINSADEFYDDEALHGERSLKHESATDDIITNLEKRILINSESNYTICGHVKTDGRNIQLSADTYSHRTYNQNHQNYITPEISATNGWKFTYQNFTTDTEARYVNVSMNSDFVSYPHTEAWFDDVSLIEWTDWISVDNLDEIEFPNDYYFVQLRTVSVQDNCMLAGKETSVSRYIPEVANNNDSSDLMLTSMFNYPNPFNPSTTIFYQLTNPANVKLDIFNIKGQHIKSLENGQQEKGYHQSVWHGKDKFGKGVASGVYFYKLQLNDKTELVKKCLMLK